MTTIRKEIQERITHAKLNKQDQAERVLCELLDALDSKGLPIDEKSHALKKFRDEMIKQRNFYQRSHQQYASAVYITTAVIVDGLNIALGNE